MIYWMFLPAMILPQIRTLSARILGNYPIRHLWQLPQQMAGAFQT
jgi:hypothetical protein